MAKGINTARDISPEKIPDHITEGTLRMPREDDIAKKELKDIVAAIKKCKKELPDLRKPVNDKQAEIKRFYDDAEKKGYNRKAIRFLVEDYDDFANAEFRLTANSYANSIGKQLTLFDTTDVSKQ